MSEWKECTLGEICTKIGSGSTPSGGKDSYKGGDFALIRSQNILDHEFSKQGLVFIDDLQAHKLNNVAVESNDILLNITGDSVARTCIVDSSVLPARVNQHVAIVRVNSNADPRFIHAWLIYKKAVLLNLASFGATRNAITKKMIENFSVNLPPLSEQKKIADILSSLDEKIETNRKINARLEELAQAIFKSWFIDFEPFGGKMPENWQPGALSDIANIIMGQSPSGENINNQQEGMIFYQGKTEFGERFPSVKNYTSNVTRIAPQNSILLSMRAPVGDVNITLNQCCIGRGIASINYKEGTNSYLYLLLKSKSDYFDIFDNGGTVFGSINKKGLEEMPIIIPNSSIINEFNEIISPIDKELERRHNESTRLASLRDTLLPELMSGELIPE